MVRPKYLEKEDIIEKEGWIFDHTAMRSEYLGSGRVEMMKNRKGFNWCRVYTSIVRGRYTVTHVYRKAVEA